MRLAGARQCFGAGVGSDVFRHPTNPHVVEKFSKTVFQAALAFTFCSHQNRVNRRNIGTCATLDRFYIVWCGAQEKGGNFVPEDALSAAPRSKIPGSSSNFKGLGEWRSG